MTPRRTASALTHRSVIRTRAMLAAGALLVAAGAALLSMTRPVHAAFGDITEYTPPTVYGTADKSMPVDIVAGPDGNLWFTERNGRAIARITPAGAITEFLIPNLPTEDAIPDGITVGPDGWIWFCESQATSSRIGRLNPLAPDPGSTMQEFPVLNPVNAGPTYITTGSDGNLWFTERRANRIGRFNPVTLELAEFQVAGSNPRLIGITSGPDGNVWFAEQFGNKIGRITPAGVITEFDVPTASSDPTYLTAGPDGKLWFTEYGCPSTAGSAETTCNPSSPPEPGNRLANIDPATGIITELAVLPTNNSKPCRLVFDATGRLWFAEQGGNNIGYVNSSGTVFEFPVTSAQSLPTGITVGSDLNIWFTEFFGEDPITGQAQGGKIGKLDTSP